MKLVMSRGEHRNHFLSKLQGVTMSKEGITCEVYRKIPVSGGDFLSTILEFDRKCRKLFQKGFFE